MSLDDGNVVSVTQVQVNGPGARTTDALVCDLRATERGDRQDAALVVEDDRVAVTRHDDLVDLSGQGRIPDRAADVRN